MADEFSLLIPAHREPKMQILVPDLKPVVDHSTTDQPTPGQQQAAQAAHAQEIQDREAHDVAAFMGIWMGTLLLNDLAAEHLSEPENEERDEKAEKKPPVTD